MKGVLTMQEFFRQRAESVREESMTGHYLYLKITHKDPAPRIEGGAGF
jgi:hypothetical protein